MCWDSGPGPGLAQPSRVRGDGAPRSSDGCPGGGREGRSPGGRAVSGPSAGGRNRTRPS